MMTGFKARTLDFVPIPREKKLVSKKQIYNNIPKEKKSFNIETKNSLKEIMLKQSASRRRVNLENE